MEAIGEIFALPFIGQGHLLPFLELCRKFCSMKFKTTLIISSDLIYAVPSSLLQHELFTIAEFTTPLPPVAPLPIKGSKHGPGTNLLLLFFQQMGDYIESILASRDSKSDPTRPVFALVDDLMCWSKGIFMKSHLPVVVFFSSGAVSSAMEYAAWKADVENLKPGETRILPGLPKYMAFNYSDLTVRRNSKNDPFKMDRGSEPDRPVEVTPEGPKHKKKSFPVEPGDEPQWLEETKGAVAFLYNTCDELEHPFIGYISSQIEVSVWAIGPLLPEEYWKLDTTTSFSDSTIRPNRKSNYTEEQVIQWLDTKPRRTVIYVSFGSQTTPKLEEYEEIAKALEELNRPFIWVVQTGPDVLMQYYPHGLDSKVGNRGLTIHGWAPQLVILNHPSIGGCLTHGGWNSTTEAIGCGIPTLVWPIRGDQFYNAKSIESHFKVGYLISTRDDESEIVTKDKIVEGIERLMSDEKVHKQAEALCNNVFKHGFPTSSVAALNAFKDFISQVAA